MNQQYSSQPDQKNIETLKAARNQIMQADRSKDVGKDTIGIQNSIPRQAHNTFAEEFVQKLTSIEKETATVDEEMAKIEKLWSSLVEKKKQLEARKNELTRVKDKLKELDREMSDALKA